MRVTASLTTLSFLIAFALTASIASQSKADLVIMNLDDFTNPNGTLAVVSSFNGVDVTRAGVASTANSGAYVPKGDGHYEYTYLGTEGFDPMTITYSLSVGTFRELILGQENSRIDDEITLSIYADGSVSTYIVSAYTVLDGSETFVGSQTILSPEDFRPYEFSTDGNFNAIRYEFRGVQPVLNGAGLVVGGIEGGMSMGYTAVPEPGAFSVLMLLSAGLGGLRRRRST